MAPPRARRPHPRPQQTLATRASLFPWTPVSSTSSSSGRAGSSAASPPSTCWRTRRTRSASGSPGGRARSSRRCAPTWPGGAPRWPLIVVDAGDRADVEALAARTRVVPRRSGPTCGTASPLVEACASAGTDYVDLTGEVLFVRESLDALRRRRPRQRRADRALVRLRLRALRPRRPAARRGRRRRRGGPARGHRARGAVVEGRDQRRHDRLGAHHGRGRGRGPLAPGRLADAVRAEPRPRVRARRRGRRRRRADPARQQPRHVGRPVRDGVVQHPHRAALERAAGLGVRPHASGTARRWRTARTCSRRCAPPR